MIHEPGIDRRWPARRGVSAATAAAGLALLAAAAVIPHRSPPKDFGTTAMSGPVAATTSIPPLSRAAEPAPRRAASSSSPTRAAATAIQPAAPSQLSIPKLGVRAPVLPISTVNGQLDVPADPQRVGWWTGSAEVGAATGTVVIDGHVDAADTGPGALYGLTDLHSSDQIHITSTAGQQQTYRVIGRRVYAKANRLPRDLFTPTGSPRLVLITCGGPFDKISLSYRDNIAVFAIPTPNQNPPNT